LIIAMASSSSMAKSFALLALTFVGPILAAPAAAPAGNDGSYQRPASEGAYTWTPQATSQIIGTPAQPSVNPDVPVPNAPQDPIMQAPGGVSSSKAPAAATPTGEAAPTDNVVVSNAAPSGGPAETPAEEEAPAETGAPSGTSEEAPAETGTSSAASGDAPAPTGESAPESSSGSSSGGSDGAAIEGKGTLYKGNGSVEKGWPGEKDWLSFESLWKNNQYALTKGCQPGDKPVVQNKPKEIEDIKAAIQEVGKESGIDERYILAVVLQESNGCVRVKTTFSPGDNIPNPGLMQCHNGKFNCNDVGDGDCTTEQIKGMVKEGTEGTDKGDGLKQLMVKAKELHKAEEMAMQAYVAMRLYNSGENSLKDSDDLSEGGATSSYASDIANRLTGHVF
jgi:hypothetical protein